MDNPPQVHQLSGGRDARAPRDTSRDTTLDRNDNGASRSMMRRIHRRPHRGRLYHLPGETPIGGSGR